MHGVRRCYYASKAGARKGNGKKTCNVGEKEEEELASDEFEVASRYRVGEFINARLNAVSQDI